MSAFYSHKLLVTITLSSLLGACASPPPPGREQPVDIYSALKNDRIQYSDGREAPESDAAIADRIAEVRNLYFDREYVEASAMAERLVRIAPYEAENYYWLARIKMALADYQQAYNMASKGMTVTKDPGLKRELKRVQRQAEIGAW
jgi:hypothetical protein